MKSPSTFFNYQEMRKVTGKQMKTVWREKEFPIGEEEMPLIWTLPAPSNGEKSFGKHPTQKPVALIERCVLASTNEGDYRTQSEINKAIAMNKQAPQKDF